MKLCQYSFADYFYGTPPQVGIISGEATCGLEGIKAFCNYWFESTEGVAFANRNGASQMLKRANRFYGKSAQNHCAASSSLGFVESISKFGISRRGQLNVPDYRD